MWHPDMSELILICIFYPQHWGLCLPRLDSDGDDLLSPRDCLKVPELVEDIFCNKKCLTSLDFWIVFFCKWTSSSEQGKGHIFRKYGRFCCEAFKGAAMLVKERADNAVHQERLKGFLREQGKEARLKLPELKNSEVVYREGELKKSFENFAKVGFFNRVLIVRICRICELFGGVAFCVLCDIDSQFETKAFLLICVSLVTNHLVVMSTAVPCPCRGNRPGGQSFTPLKIFIWNPKNGGLVQMIFLFMSGCFSGFSGEYIQFESSVLLRS